MPCNCRPGHPHTCEHKAECRCIHCKPVPVLDLTKPVQTQDGRPVKLICTTGPVATWPLWGFIADNTYPTNWSIEGRWYSYATISPLDLINVPRKPVEEEVYLYMHQSQRNDRCVHVAKHPKGWRPRENKLLAVKRVVIKEGDGQGELF